MERELIVKTLAEIVKKAQSGEGTGHDWWHTKRVLDMAKRLQKEEGGNLFVIELAALLHDIADFKFTNNEKAGAIASRKILKELNVDETTIDEVCLIIENISFKGIKEKNKIKTVEGKIVQDADRLDAIGALGLARCFAYGGKDDREIYNPEIKPNLTMDQKTYRMTKSTSINHLYEKHLLLKDLLNTESAKKIAENRHQFTLEFLGQFYKEWNGED